jgi:hypothetical protein
MALPPDGGMTTPPHRCCSTKCNLGRVETLSPRSNSGVSMRSVLLWLIGIPIPIIIILWLVTGHA